MPTNDAFAALGNGVISSLVLAPNLEKLRQAVTMEDGEQCLCPRKASHGGPGDSRYTLFAPTNEAFEAMGIGVATSLLMPSNQVKLYQIVRYHLLTGVYVRDDFTANTAVQTLEQSLLKISSVRPLAVDGVRSTNIDIPATNGVMHMLSGVLLPIGFRFPDKNVVQVGESTDTLSTFTSLVLLAELTDQLAMDGPYTVFAPTNAALAALGPTTLETLRQSENRELLQKILKYHPFDQKWSCRKGCCVPKMAKPDVALDVDGGMAVTKSLIFGMDAEREIPREKEKEKEKEREKEKEKEKEKKVKRSASRKKRGSARSRSRSKDRHRRASRRSRRLSSSSRESQHRMVPVRQAKSWET
eukprot:Skav209969  [mRNA]  locus=scaffold4929:35814:58182:- [translate_table: standard]